MKVVIYVQLEVNNKKYDIEIEKKKTTKNTYIRVKKDLTIHVTTNAFTSDRSIYKLIDDNYPKIVKMINAQTTKKRNNEGFYYLGKKYDIVYVDSDDIVFGEEKVFINKNLDIDKWYKKKAKYYFLERFDLMYNSFSKKVPYPSLKIRKMTSRWGVCNIKLKTITLNLELIKRDTKYLDYVIVHELSHLVHGDHSARFWNLVENNCPDYKKIVKEMKDF